MNEVNGTVDDRGNVTWSPEPTKDCAFFDYARAAIEAGATLDSARDSFALALREAGSPKAADYTVRTSFDAAWRKAEAKRIGDEDREARQRQTNADREDLDAIASEIAQRHPIEARRAQLVRALVGKQYDRQLARKLAAEAIPDAAPAGEDAPLIQTGAEFFEGAGDPDAECIAPGLAYRERAVLAHSKRGEGKSTICAWLVARATCEGRRTLVIVDDDPGTWQRRLKDDFGANRDHLFAGAAAALSPAGALEQAVADARPAWIVVDNWRTWALSSGIQSTGGFSNTEAAGSIIGRLVSVARGGPALTLLHNEGWHDDTRSRDSSAVEDAVDATRKVRVFGDVTEVQPGGKTRIGIDREIRRWRMRDDGSGMDYLGTGPRESAAGDGDEDYERQVAEYLQKHRALSWTQFRKHHARQVLHMNVGNDRLKALFDRARDHLNRGGPSGPTLPRDRADRPVLESGPRCGPIERTAQDRAVLGGGPNGPDTIGGPPAADRSVGGPVADRFTRGRDDMICEFEGCTEKGSPRAVVNLSEPANRPAWNVCDSCWASWSAETTEVPSEPAPPGGCDPAEFRAWLARVQWRPPTEAEVAAERARLMGEQSGTIH